MYKSLGNVLVNPKVGLLFIRWTDGPRRIRVQGRASLHHEDPLIAEWEGAQFVVRVQAERIFLNCPRYLHRMELAEYSAYAPGAGGAAGARLEAAAPISGGAPGARPGGAGRPRAVAARLRRGAGAGQPAGQSASTQSCSVKSVPKRGLVSSATSSNPARW